MNNLKHILIIFLRLKRRSQAGFTLIELLVVSIIVGILVAIGVPNFINQLGKSRETEGKIGLGALARSQQAYHFEKRSFADTMDNLSLTGQVESKYYDFEEPNPVNGNYVQHKAMATDPDDRVRNYAVGVYYNAGSFDLILCQGEAIGDDVNTPANVTGQCDGVQIE